VRIGILRETRDPPDRRVPFTPGQVAELNRLYPDLEIIVQPSKIRCYTDQEYLDHNAVISDDLSACELLIGVKEVDIDALIPGKSYLFFSHTAKKQSYNRKLLQAIASKGITLIDYEYLTGPDGIRVVAFGCWAGIVGAYNGLRAYGERYHIFLLQPAHQCHDRSDMTGELQKVSLQPIKVLVTGGGRVAGGALETFREAGIKEVSPEEYLNRNFDEAVVCRIDPWHYVRRSDGSDFDLQHFFSYPNMYESTFKPYTKVTDLFIPCHFWDPASPVFMTHSDMREPDFKIRVIADVSCDLNGPVPSTIRASTIADPFYGYDPMTETETPPFNLRSITVMAVDNLPGELPRDASEDFGEMLIGKVIPALVGKDSDRIIERATITENGILTKHFDYLQDYLDGKDSRT